MDIVGITFVDDCDFAEAIFAIAGFVLKQVIFASTAAHYSGGALHYHFQSCGSVWRQIYEF